MAAADLISVIVLNHNKAAYSEACLNSLLHSTHSPVEVIAVDNGSTDETPQIIEAFRQHAAEHNVHCEVLTNDSNVGAIVGRNQAMERAQGEYFVFVDNDVLVRDRDWLEKMRGALDSTEKAAIVSAKCVFPWAPHDIEFAGCAVSANGRIKYLGRGAARDDPAFNTRCEVQCVISACILFPRWLVDEIGPLDEVYTPVQFEDLDFCYRARSKGYSVLYEPAAEMYHYEHTTTDGSVDINFRYVTIKNGRTFKQRWQRMFAHEGGPPDDETRWIDLPRQKIDECPPPPPR